jgi:transposase
MKYLIVCVDIEDEDVMIFSKHETEYEAKKELRKIYYQEFDNKYTKEEIINYLKNLELAPADEIINKHIASEDGLLKQLYNLLDYLKNNSNVDVVDSVKTLIDDYLLLEIFNQVSDTKLSMTNNTFIIITQA